MKTVPRDIRFYCLCGLKMRITADMYGKPGKCVSCRQKFWVPKGSELPETDHTIRLADHPELMRRSGDRVRPEDRPAREAQSAPAAEITPEIASKDSASGSGTGSRSAAVAARLAAAADTASESSGEEPTAPLDDLEPLRQVLAYQQLMTRRMRDTAAGGADGTDTDTHRAYRRVIERARARVEQRLRELLFETGRRLVEVLGDIAKTTLKFRVGEISPDTYFELVGRLRLRREWLDRQRVNLKNWLRTDNVYLLGGPDGVTLEDMNLSRIEVFLPAEETEERTLLQKYIAELRDAFDARSVAERRRTEWRRMVREGELPEEAMQEGPLQATADAQRARARLLHCRARLRQVIKDCDTDMSALQAYQLLLVQGALPRSRGDMPREELMAEAATVGQALADLRVWRDWASNAATAEDPGDLPLSPPTLFRRLAEPSELRRFALESVPAYTGALCLMLLALLPVAMARAGFLAGMVFMVIVPAFSSRSRRGAAYVAIWIVETFLMGLALRFAEAEPAARAYLADPVHLAWMATAALGAWVAMGISASLVLRKLAGGYAWAPPTAGVAGILLFLAALLLGSPPAAPTAAQTKTGQATETVLPPTVMTPPSAPEIPAALPKPVDAVPAANPLPAKPATPPAAPILPTTVAEPPKPDTPPVAVAKPSAVPRIGAATAAAAPQNPGMAPSTVDPAPIPGETAVTPAEPVVTGPLVELRGVMQKEGDQPRFRIVLNANGGRNRTMDIFLGETVYGPWKASEYNATTKKLTLSNAKKLVVLDTGEPVELPE